MPRQKLHTGSIAVSSRHKTASHIIITAKSKDFPVTAGSLTIISPVTDINNTPDHPNFGFNASVISNTAKKALIQLIAKNPAGGAITPFDGILSITLIDDTDPAAPVTMGVADIPVDYVDDPLAPVVP